MSDKIFPLEQVKVEILPGMVARFLVDPIYEAAGAKARARNDDLFFLALLEKRPIGCVRFCVEEQTALLRSMMVAEEYRGLGVGEKLLAAFEAFLVREGVRDTFCLPYAHLEEFYGKIGFAKVGEAETPPFLLVRMVDYNQGAKRMICMKRAGG